MQDLTNSLSGDKLQPGKALIFKFGIWNVTKLVESKKWSQLLECFNRKSFKNGQSKTGIMLFATLLSCVVHRKQIFQFLLSICEFFPRNIHLNKALRAETMQGLTSTLPLYKL